jgi:lysophospholipase L1-like esterase
LLGLALAGLVALAPASAFAVTAGDSYVALGDSFTAGPGIPPPDTSPPPGCLRSRSNYPKTAASSENLDLKLDDVSCSGAKTDDMTSSQNVEGPDPPPQFDALARETDLVTIGIGGNDIGFTEIVRNCASPTPEGTPCQDRYKRGDRDEISARIKRTAPKVASVLKGIHRRSPNAPVYLVNYLPILPVDGSSCWPQLPITRQDAPYLRDKQAELNEMLAAQAKANDATLVDAYEAGEGKDACKEPGVRWVEPAAGVGAAPLHPNKLGMDGTADEVEGAVESTPAQ